jgi:hypothetical protein
VISHLTTKGRGLIISGCNHPKLTVQLHVIFGIGDNILYSGDAIVLDNMLYFNKNNIFLS